MLPETSMSIWIPALHSGMTESTGLWLEVTESPSVPVFSKESAKGTKARDRGLRILRVDFFSALNPAKTFFNPSEIENFYGDVIGIQQNCQLHGSNLPLHHVAQLALVSYCHSHFHLFQC